MSAPQEHPAVLFLVFNRPDTTARVFEVIRRERPARLYVAADGPRQGHPTDGERCAAVRNLVQSIDWPCEPHFLLRENNLGCRRAIGSAITWFFEHEPEGIILEDDCLPDPSFFPYCSTLLERYRDDARVMHISGANFQRGTVRGRSSYYFSRYVHVWGWASWRRAWAAYDADMVLWDEFVSSGGLRSTLQGTGERRYWSRVMARAAAGQIDTWDYQWTFSVWSQHGLAVIPNVNLVENIGFGSDATHTSGKWTARFRIPVHPIGRLEHPRLVIPDREADAFTFDRYFRVPLQTRLRRSFGGALR